MTVTSPSVRAKSAWVLKMYELLADGPRPMTNVVDLLIPVVPVGYAARVGKAKNIQDKRKRTERGAQRDVSEVADKAIEKTVRCGAQRTILRSLYSHAKSGNIEKYEEDGRTMLRLKGKVLA